MNFNDLCRLKKAENGTNTLDIYDPVNTILFISACCDHKQVRKINITTLLQRHNKQDDFVYYLIQLCDFIPTYAWKQRAVAVFRKHLEHVHLSYCSRYTLKVGSCYCKQSMKRWVFECIKMNGQSRPHWKEHVMSRINLVDIPKITWNLKLVNVQKSTKSCTWGKGEGPTTTPCQLKLAEATPHPGCSAPDAIRIPANSKTRINEPEHNASEKQTEYNNKWLRDTGINRDLAPRNPFHQKHPEELVTPPSWKNHNVAHPPQDLIGDLRSASSNRSAIFTVEDKGPSVLWQLNGNSLMYFWKQMMEKASDRWEIQKATNKEILSKYHDILKNVLPRNLTPGSNTFGTPQLPYAYFTVKFKCFQACHQSVAGHITARSPSTSGDLGTPVTHPAHTCRKPGHSCMRNIVSFKRLPGRNTFRRIGRAFMHGLRSVTPGFGVRDLSKGRDII